jgi:hypothetical protein
MKFKIYPKIIVFWKFKNLVYKANKVEDINIFTIKFLYSGIFIISFLFQFPLKSNINFFLIFPIIFHHFQKIPIFNSQTFSQIARKTSLFPSVHNNSQILFESALNCWGEPGHCGFQTGPFLPLPIMCNSSFSSPNFWAIFSALNFDATPWSGQFRPPLFSTSISARHNKTWVDSKKGRLARVSVGRDFWLVSNFHWPQCGLASGPRFWAWFLIRKFLGLNMKFCALIDIRLKFEF